MIDWDRIPFRKCIKELKKEFHSDFAYDSKKYSKKEISLKLEANSLDQVLDELSKILNTRWEVIDEIVMILPREEEWPTKIYRVSGTVNETLGGERLPGALVYFEPSQRSTLTNNDGYFYLEGAGSGDENMVIRYLGYKVVKIPLEEIENHRAMRISLEREPNLLEEVTVKENPDNTVFQSQEISKISFNQAKMKNFPTVGEVDPFRSIQLLPGIGSTDENLSGISIRGGSGDQSLVLYDGFKIYHLDHFFGFVSAFNADALKKINIYKGAYPSNFGGGASGIVEMKGKTGDPEKLHGSLGVNLLSVQATLEVPIAKKWSVFLAGRRSYTDIFASPSYKKMMENVLNNDERTVLSGKDKSYDEFNPEYFYYDLNGKVSFRPNEKNLFTLTLFNSQDRFRINNSSQLPEFSFETENRTSWGLNGIGFSWFSNFNNAWFSQVNVGFSNYFSTVDFGSLLSDSSFNQFEETVFFSQGNEVVDLNIGWDNEVTISPKNKLKFGFQYLYNFIGFRVIQDSVVTDNVREEANQPVVYIEDEYRLFQRLRIKGGIRALHYSLRNKFFLEPRFSLDFALTPNILLKAAYGIFNQNISRVIRRDVFASNPEFWALSDGVNIPTLKSTHYVLGSVISLGNHFKLDVEGYLKDNKGLVEYFPAEGIFAINQTGFDPYFSGDGFGIGLDILFQAQAKNHSGWISYSLAGQREKFEGLNNGEFFPSQNDQTIELKLGYIFQYKAWEFSAVWIYGSGKPFTAPLGTIDVETPSGDSVEILVVSGINSERLPDYHRLDLAAKYSFSVGQALFQIGFSVFNVYNRENIKDIRFKRDPKSAGGDFSIGGYQAFNVEQLGILPGISLKAEF